MTATQTACSNRRLVDRYLLGELPEAQARAFEEHYFDCPVCGEEMRVASALLDGVQASAASPARTTEMPVVVGPVTAANVEMVRPRTPEPKPAASPGARIIRPSRWRWPLRLAAAAAFPLAASVAFQALVVLPGLREEIALRDRPRVLAPTTLRPLTRGPTDVTRLTAAPGDRFVTVQLAVREPVATSYRVRLLDSADRPSPIFGEMVVRGPAPGEPIHILIPLAGMSAGRYALDITPQPDGKHSKPDRYRFSLELPGGEP